MTVLIALGCFAAGTLVGVVLRDALELYRQSRKDRPMPFRITLRHLTAAGLIVAVGAQLVVGIMLIGVKQTAVNGEEYGACAAGWQQQFAAAYRARAAAADDVSAAVETIIRAIKADDSAAVGRAITRYVEVRDRQIRQQRHHPLPPVPNELCGEQP